MRHSLEILTAAVLLLSSCGTRVNTETPVPRTSVNYELNIMVDAPILDTQGGYFTATEPTRYGQYIGYAGLLIFHGFDNRFYSYDLCCPYECKRDVRVVPSMVGTARCPVCGSEFDVGFGSGFPTKGPSTFPLRRYNTYVNGYNIRVTN